MKVLLWGIFLVCLGFLIHVILWKIRLPRKHTKALLQIFLGTLFLGVIIIFWSARSSGHIHRIAPEHLSEYLHIALLVISFTLAYIITYSALEADSPSLVMIMKIANAGVEGVGKTRFEQLMSDDLLILPRIRDLLRDNLVYQEGEKYKLTAKGRVFARIFIVYRQILKIDRKGG